jgi:prepilin-type N-terminal cleavage/methylation domain-containing protein
MLSMSSPSPALCQQRTHAGFTLVELLLAMGVIGVLLSSAMVAINPAAQLTSARDAERRHHENQLQKAMFMHLIEQSRLPGDKPLPEGQASRLPLCRVGITDPGCVNVSADLIPTYIVDLPVDPAETDLTRTGYAAYLTAGRPVIQAEYLGN